MGEAADELVRGTPPEGGAVLRLDPLPLEQVAGRVHVDRLQPVEVLVVERRRRSARCRRTPTAPTPPPPSTGTSSEHRQRAREARRAGRRSRRRARLSAPTRGSCTASTLHPAPLSCRVHAPQRPYQQFGLRKGNRAPGPVGCRAVETAEGQPSKAGGGWSLARGLRLDRGAPRGGPARLRGRRHGVQPLGDPGADVLLGRVEPLPLRGQVGRVRSSGVTPATWCFLNTAPLQGAAVASSARTPTCRFGSREALLARGLRLLFYALARSWAEPWPCVAAAPCCSCSSAPPSR